MKKAFYLIILISLIVVTAGNVWCQPLNAVYANSQTNGGTSGLSSYEVQNPGNAIHTVTNVEPNLNYARLTASTALGTATAWLQLAFPASVPANATVYIKTATTASALLGGGVTIAAFSTPTGTGNSVALAYTAPKTYYTGDGNMYLAVTPTGNFQSIRITLASPLALGSNTMDVFFAFYGPTAGNDSNPFPFNVADCGLPNVSTFGSSGISIGSFGVNNPGYAIDGNASTTASSFYASGLSVLSGHIFQTFFFNGLSNTADAVRIVLAKNGAVTALSLAGSIKVQGYNGATPVGTSQLFSTLLDVDLLNLLSTDNNKVTAYFAPKDVSNNPVIFDRITVDLDLGLLGVALGSNGLNIFDVRRVPDVPTAPDLSVCANVGIAALSAVTVQESLSGIGAFTYHWYDALQDGSLLHAGKNYLVSGLSTAGQVKNYYVDIQKSGCGTTSGKKKVHVNIINPPVLPGVDLTN
jgi:hypothetical protein